MAWPIDEEHFGTAVKRRQKGVQLVAKITAGTMNEDDRR
jgi:hypothetical protein